MPVLRELYLCLLFLVGAGVSLAPYLLGIGESAFAYETAKGAAVDLPVSVSVYACLLLISIAVFVLRIVSRKSGEPSHVG